MHDASGLQQELQGYRVTTAEIVYHLPDHPGVLQTFVWQQLDIAPQFPALHRFLEFWHREIEGHIHSVRVGACSLVSPGEAQRQHYRH